MKLDVKERGRAVATYRSVLVTLMETVARWVPTTPEMEVKTLFGAHIWDLAQHADAFGKRTHELRLPLQHSIPPTEEYSGWLSALGALEQTGERIAALYDVALPALAARYRDYLGRTDELMDAPTVRIIERILADNERMFRERSEVKLPSVAAPDAGWVKKLLERERGLALVDAAAEKSVQGQP
jgi:hypothetical protein